MIGYVQTVLEETQPASYALRAIGPAELFLQLVCEISRRFDCKPLVRRAPEQAGLSLLYRDASFPWRALTEPLADVLAAICEYWPLKLCGAAAQAQLAELTICWEQGLRVTRLRAMPGTPPACFEGLLLSLETESAATAQHLAEICACMEPSFVSVALPRRHEGFLDGCAMVEQIPGSLFLYLSQQKTAHSALLDGLNLLQKEQLWRTFLEDGVQNVEFQWLYSAYQEGRAVYLLEWALALENVFAALGFQVRQAHSQFQVTDAAGRERRFDLIQGGPAEKMLLKILFPQERK